MVTGAGLETSGVAQERRKILKLASGLRGECVGRGRMSSLQASTTGVGGVLDSLPVR